MIYLINFLTMALFTFLTLGFLPNLQLFGVVPLLPLFFVIALAYFRKGFEPIFFAAVFGIILDINSAFPFGTYLLVFLTVAGVVRYMFQEGMKTLSFVSFMAIAAASTAVTIIAQTVFVLFNKTPISTLFVLPIIAFIGVNLFYAILVYAFSVWYFDRIERLEHELKRR